MVFLLSFIDESIITPEKLIYTKEQKGLIGRRVGGYWVGYTC